MITKKQFSFVYCFGIPPNKRIALVSEEEYTNFLFFLILYQLIIDICRLIKAPFEFNLK